MAISFGNLRARKNTNFETLQKKLESTEKGGFSKDPNIWKPTPKDDKSSNIIRFLPIPYVDEVGVEACTIRAEDLTPMAKVLRHNFQGPGGWFMENSPATIQLPDYVREIDGPQWGPAKKNNDTAAQNVLKKRLPKTDYYANILVIKDGTNPENNGKVFKYQFGETVRKIIEKSNKPDFDTDPSFDCFDMFDGADLILNLTYEKKKIGDREQLVPDFKTAKWAACSPACGGDEQEMERVWKASHSIADYYDKKHFKSYEELKAKYHKVMDSGSGSGSSAKPKTAEEMMNEMTSGSVVTEAKALPEKVAQSVGKTASSPAASAASSSGNVDEELAMFELLLNS